MNEITKRFRALDAGIANGAGVLALYITAMEAAIAELTQVLGEASMHSHEHLSAAAILAEMRTGTIKLVEAKDRMDDGAMLGDPIEVDPNQGTLELDQETTPILDEALAAKGDGDGSGESPSEEKAKVKGKKRAGNRP